MRDIQGFWPQPCNACWGCMWLNSDQYHVPCLITFRFFVQCICAAKIKAAIVNFAC
jgi:hypothetical protein